jgi:hypothetical protein
MASICCDCYDARCWAMGLASKNKKNCNKVNQDNTVGLCGEAGCISLPNVQARYRSLLEDVNCQLWRCAPCDYIVLVLGRSPSEFQGRNTNACPTPKDHKAVGPISAHRFNDTQCFKCEEYASWGPWTKGEEEGTWLCARCANAPCAGCSASPIFVEVSFRKKHNMILCPSCSFHAGQGGNLATYQQRFKDFRATLPGPYAEPRCDRVLELGAGRRGRDGGIRCKTCDGWRRIQDEKEAVANSTT